MNISYQWLVGAALSSLLIAGCVSKVTEKEQYSGYLSSYDGLQEVTTSSGQKVLRWVAPGFTPSTYDTVVFDRLELYPKPKPDERVNLQTLEELQTFTSDSARSVLAQKYQVVPSLQAVPSGSRTLIMRAAITGVAASDEGMRWYEVVPIAAVVGATEAVTGHRDQNTELYIEAEFVDAASGLPVVRVVRKVFGETLKNASQEITAADFKAAISGMTRDMQALLM